VVLLASTCSPAGSLVYCHLRGLLAPVVAFSRSFSRWPLAARSSEALEASALVRLAGWDPATHLPVLRLPRVPAMVARASSLP
jgi:hypothetical protein